MGYLNNRSVLEDDYLPSPSGLDRLASVERRVAYDHRVSVDALGAQQHSLGTNIFAFGLLPGVISDSHVPFTADPRSSATVNFTYAGFDRDVHAPPGKPPGSLEATYGSNYDFLMGTDFLPPAARSVSVLPAQRPTNNGTQSATPTAWPTSSNIRGHPARSDGGVFVSKDAHHMASPRLESATPTHAFPGTFSNASSSGVYSAQSSSSTFPPYPHSRFSTSAPVPQGPASSASRCASSSVHPREKPAPRPMTQEGPEQPKPGRTLRSVRTRSEDVYAEYELNEDGTAGRWVCQCGSTFVRDSDWERHAMHSLSHSEGGGYDCTICDISFTRSDAMFRHRRKKHGDTVPGGKGAGG